MTPANSLPFSFFDVADLPALGLTNSTCWICLLFPITAAFEQKCLSGGREECTS